MSSWGIDRTVVDILARRHAVAPPYWLVAPIGALRVAEALAATAGLGLVPDQMHACASEDDFAAVALGTAAAREAFLHSLGDRLQSAATSITALAAQGAS